jgi:hypothetical protein
MSKTTTIIANHKLDTSSLENLASDLSNRLQATVEYGYIEEFNYNPLKNTYNEDSKTIILGNIVYPNSQKTYTLFDTYFQYSAFIKKYGIAALENPLFKKETYFKNKILEAQKAKEFQLLEEDGNELAIIFRDTINLLAVDSLDWSAYQNTFIYKTENDWLKYLTIWRIKNRDWIYKFGGNYMLVSHCEEVSEFIYNDAIFKTGIAIKNKITKKLNGQIVNISNYFKSKSYLNKPEYEQTYLEDAFFKKLNNAIKDNIPFTKIKIKYPSVVYDDFQDIENSTPLTTNEFNFIYDGSEILKQLAINKNYQKEMDTIKRNPKKT